MSEYARKERCKNIHVRGATVCFNDKQRGWALPGRRLTTDHEVAYRACCVMAAIIGGGA